MARFAIICASGIALLVEQLIEFFDKRRNLLVGFDFLFPGAIDGLLYLSILFFLFDFRCIGCDVLLQIANAQIQATQQLLTCWLVHSRSRSHHIARPLQQLQRLLGLLFAHVVVPDFVAASLRQPPAASVLHSRH